MDADHESPAPPRLTMKAFWHDFGEEVLSLERGLPWTFARLCTAPGALVRRYVDVRDPRIVRPLRYFLIGFALAALSFQAFGGVESAREGFLRGAEGRRGGEEAILAMWAVLSQLEWLLLLLVLPAMSAALCLGFRRHRPGFAEMWVLCLFLIGHVLALEALLLLLDEWGRVPGASIAAALLPPVMFLATCVGYFPGTAVSRLWRSAAAALGALFFTIAGLNLVMFAVGLVRSLVASL